MSTVCILYADIEVSMCMVLHPLQYHRLQGDLGSSADRSHTDQVRYNPRRRTRRILDLLDIFCMQCTSLCGSCLLRLSCYHHICRCWLHRQEGTCTASVWKPGTVTSLSNFRLTSENINVMLYVIYQLLF